MYIGCTTNDTCNGSSLSNTYIIGMLKWNIFGPDYKGKGYLSAIDTKNNLLFYNIDHLIMY